MKFLGFIDDPRECYPMLDLLVMPSRKETFGLVLIEAMAFGLPVVATDAGGVPEIVVDGDTGLLVPPEDAEVLALAIEELMANRERVEEMGRKGRERILNKYRLSDYSHYKARF